jgi:hypothetical protein
MGNRRHRAGVRTEAAVRPVRTQLFSSIGLSVHTQTKKSAGNILLSKKY